VNKKVALEMPGPYAEGIVCVMYVFLDRGKDHSWVLTGRYIRDLSCSGFAELFFQGGDTCPGVVQGFVQFPHHGIAVTVGFIREAVSHLLYDKKQVGKLTYGFDTFPVWSKFILHGVLRIE
jgi:hypothetical protein